MQTIRMQLCAPQTPRFCVTGLGLTWVQIYWTHPKTGPSEIAVKSTSTTPSLAEAAPWDGREVRWDVIRHLPKSLPVPKHYTHEPALVLLVHSDTFEHGYRWVRHPEACETHASLGLLSSHHKIAAIARSGGKAQRAHPTPAGTSKHEPRLPCSPSSHALCLSPCSVAFGLYQAQGPQTPARASLF